MRLFVYIVPSQFTIHRNNSQFITIHNSSQFIVTEQLKSCWIDKIYIYILIIVYLRWGEVKWGEVKWSEVKWNEVKWSDVTWSEVKRNESKWNEMKKVKWNGMKWNEIIMIKKAPYKTFLQYSVFSLCSTLFIGSQKFRPCVSRCI